MFSLCFFYFKQEKFFFNPKLLDKNYAYEFSEPFEEVNIVVDKNVEINTLLFKAKDSTKGIVLYLHGNAGALHDWGKRAPLFLDNNYDVLFVDYRGYGKSDGFYTKPEQVFSDLQIVYDYVLQSYEESNVTILGYSIGSGFAAYLASKNNPKRLILNAPYYSWKDLIANQIVPPIPQYLIKYDFSTHTYLDNVECPIYIFHGTRDFLIKPSINSEKLKAEHPDKITLTLIKDAPHNGIHITKQYYDALKEVLKD